MYKETVFDRKSHNWGRSENTAHQVQGIVYWGLVYLQHELWAHKNCTEPEGFADDYICNICKSAVQTTADLKWVE